jgi:hypothetical protein
VYAAAGVAGFAACWSFYRIRFRRHRTSPRSAALHRGLALEMGRSLRSPFAGSLIILERDRTFRRYETAFMCYGMAFMMLQPVIPVFLVEVLHVDYSQASNARGLIFYSMMVLFSPVFGRMLDRSDPVKLSAFAFLLLALFPSASSSSTVGSAYISFCIHGAGCRPSSSHGRWAPSTSPARRFAVYMGAYWRWSVCAGSSRTARHAPLPASFRTTSSARRACASRPALMCPRPLARSDGAGYRSSLNQRL